jgi:hypothetical protein
MNETFSAYLFAVVGLRTTDVEHLYSYRSEVFLQMNKLPEAPFPFGSLPRITLLPLHLMSDIADRL